MENVYEVFDTDGKSLGLIVATEEVVNMKYPGRYQFVRENNALPPIVTVEAMKKRFTTDEFNALTAFVAAAEQAQQKTRLATFLDAINAASGQYWLAGPFADKDKSAAIAANVLTAERADIVFSPHVSQSEAP